MDVMHEIKALRRFGDRICPDRGFHTEHFAAIEIGGELCGEYWPQQRQPVDLNDYERHRIELTAPATRAGFHTMHRVVRLLEHGRSVVLADGTVIEGVHHA